MKVAVVQSKASSNVKENINKMVAAIKEAVLCKAQFVLFPEVFLFSGEVTKEATFEKIAEKIPGEKIKIISSLAKRHGIFILAGSMHERPKDHFKVQEKKVYNTSVLIDDSGKIKAIYRKRHLFDAVVHGKKIKESEFFYSGRKSCISSVYGFSLGMSICYDLRFFQMYQNYAKKGVSIFCIPSSFTEATGEAHWEVLLRARAIDNKCYVLAPNQCGTNRKGIPLYGNSMIIDPWGKILGRASSRKEEIIYAKIEKKFFSQQKIRFLKYKNLENKL